MSTRSLTRREVLKTFGLVAGGVALNSSCAKRVNTVVTAPTSHAVIQRHLAPVKVAADRVIRTVVGLRPFRPSGFVVRAETLGDKLLVHNYGHGGGGITLSWGTSELAVDEAWKAGQTRFAVLGCGAVGLATARLIQRRGGEVTIYAKELPPHTTSNIAGGQWSPTSVMEASLRTAASDAVLARAARLSHASLQQLPGREYGIRWIENYVVSDEPLGEWWEQSLIRDLYPTQRDLKPGEHPFAARYARSFTTMLIEPPIYLTAMERDVRLAGGRIVIRELRSREELQALPEPVLVNCTGLGAKALFGDEELEPVRGQLTFLLPQPEVDYIVISGGHLYMFPRQDGILLGGTFEHGNWSLEVSEETRQQILTGHRALFESMR